MDNRNAVLISGKIETVNTIRFTPAGFTVLDFTIANQSRQIEAGVARTVIAKFHCTLIGEKVESLSHIQIGMLIHGKGFLAPDSTKNPRRLTIHITQYKLTN